MPATKLQEKARRKYVTPKEFGEQFSIKGSSLSRLLKRQEMQEAIIMVGPAQRRIDLDLGFEIMQKIFR